MKTISLPLNIILLILCNIFKLSRLQNEVKTNPSLDGVYYIKNYNYLLYLDLSTELLLSKKTINTAQFRIKKIPNSDYYYLINFNTNNKIGIGEKNIISFDENTQNINNITKCMWKFIPIDKNNKIDRFNSYENCFFIQNKYNNLVLGTNKTPFKYTQKMNLKFFEIDKINKNNAFYFFKLFEEKDNYINNSSFQLIENEPIDLIITTNINKNLKTQNELLKFILRSIIINIPWINKIYIILSNKNINLGFLNEISHSKIIFISIKDLLEFDTDSNNILNLNLYKLKEKFNISDNFLLMYGNSFINKKLNKSDFFYENNGNIYPLITSNEFNEANYQEIFEEYKRKNARKKLIDVNSENGIYYSEILSIKFLFQLISNSKNNLIFPKYNNNLISLNINYIKDLYKLIEEKYEHSNEALSSNTNNINMLNSVFLFLGYMKNIQNLKVNSMKNKDIALNDFIKMSLTQITNIPLFSIYINEQENKNYLNNYAEELKILAKIFFTSTKYEKNDDNNSIEKLLKNKELIINRIDNIISNLKKLNLKNKDYLKKRRGVFRKNRKIRSKISGLGRKSDELQTYISILEKTKKNFDTNVNKTELFETITKLEKEINILNEGYYEVSKYDKKFFGLKTILFVFFILIIFCNVIFNIFRCRYKYNKKNTVYSVYNNSDFNYEDNEEVKITSGRFESARNGEYF